MTPQNLLYIISDEHTYRALGCYGNPTVQTPHLDQLAANGTLFTNAYCPSPTCVPCRASLATGRWVHDIGTTSSAQPYEGATTGISWHHRLRDSGHRVASIGKLHFRGSDSDNGFSEEIIPLHIVNGRGWVKGLIRDRLISYDRETKELATQIGPGPSSYTDYDLRVTDEAKKWLQKRSDQPEEKPWALFLSFVSPHYPLYAPQPFYDLYTDVEIEPPMAGERSDWPDHPYLRDVFYKFCNYADHFDPESTMIAKRSYYALCSFLDYQIGQVLDVLRTTGQYDQTRIVYTSDHGDLLGDHGQWTKMMMYEGSAGIPFIMSGPDIPAGKIVDTPINLVDSYPTILDNMDMPLTPREQSDLPGTSLFQIIENEPQERVTFSEYHDGMTTGFYMLRKNEWKFVYYAGYRPQLFNLDDDPYEQNDLGTDPDWAAIRTELEAELRKIVGDPDLLDASIKTEQARILSTLGGVEKILSVPDSDFGFTPIRV